EGPRARLAADPALVAELDATRLDEEGENGDDDQIGEKQRDQNADQRGRLAQGDAGAVAQFLPDARRRAGQIPFARNAHEGVPAGWVWKLGAQDGADRVVILPPDATPPPHGDKRHPFQSGPDKPALLHSGDYKADTMSQVIF